MWPRPIVPALAVAALLTGAGPAADAATWYVDRASASCSNSGANAGSEARPYCTISAAVNARGGPGVTILVRPGVYPEQVTITASGNPLNPLVLRASANGVVVDGAHDFSNPAQWTHYEGDVWLAPGVSWDPRQVFAAGARLTSETGNPDQLPAGTFRWVDGQGLYVNAGGGHPAVRQIRVGRRNYGFSMFGRSWITIEGFSVTRTEDRGINVSGSCTNIALTGNTVTFSYRMGIQISGGSGMVLSSNTVSNSRDHGISLTNGVTGSTLEGNESSGNVHPTQELANGIYLFGSPGNVLRRNRLHHNQDSGVHIQSGSDDCFLVLNHSWNNGDHGFDHLGASGTIHVLSVASGNHRDGFSIEGGSTRTQIYHSIGADNGITANHSDLWVEGGSTEGFTSNYNLFWNSSSQMPIKYIATRYATVVAYSAVSGQDQHSLQANPRFVNPAAGDFRLKKDSPAHGLDPAGSEPVWPSGDEGPNRPNRFRPGNGPPPGRPPHLPRGNPGGEAGTAVAGESSGALRMSPDGTVAENPETLPPTVAPNPFARSATLRFSTARHGPLTVAIFDLSGRRLRTLTEDPEAPAGSHVLPLDDRGEDGGRLAPGVYLYRIRSVDGVAHGRFVLMK